MTRVDISEYAAENRQLDASFLARLQLMDRLAALIRLHGWTQKEAASRLGVTQPRISDLTRGKVDLFSLDTLVDMAALAGLNPHIVVQGSHAVAPEAGMAL